MSMLLCQITTITFVVYATIQSVLHYRLRAVVKKHRKHCKECDE